MRVLDLFCGAGGAAVGYHRAGFQVFGVDIEPQPHYPFKFTRADALTVIGGEQFWAGEFDLIHASPPCQAYSTTKTLHDAKYPDLVGEVRRSLQRTGIPYVIENVRGAPLDAIKLCGSSFGLPIRRHRLFESTLPLWSLGCAHRPDPIDVTGGGPSTKPRPDRAGGRTRKPRTVAEAGDALGIDWMTRNELNEAIPPAFTEFIGAQLLEQLKRGAA